MAEFLGLLAADGHVSADGRCVRFTNNDGSLRARAAQLWSRLFLGRAREWEGVSGFDATATVSAVDLVGAPTVGPWLRDQLYTRTGYKRVPAIVLNAGGDAPGAFLAGYYAGDGLKRETARASRPTAPSSRKASTGSTTHTIALRRYTPSNAASAWYYQLNVPSPVPVGAPHHLRKDPAEVRRVRPSARPSEWLFDLETESGVFCCGVGRVVVHNSERRGLEFVTRKITWHAAAIRLGLAEELRLGNLESHRDWGYAKDYVEAMWLMLQQDEPDDFVVATGVSHTVRDCLEIAFDHAGIEIDGRVHVDDALIRPAEVDLLVGDPTKAREQLDWTPTTSFEQLIRLMVDSDVKLLARSEGDVDRARDLL